MATEALLLLCTIACWGTAYFLPKLASQSLSAAAIVCCNAVGYLVLMPWVIRATRATDWPVRADHFWGVVVGMLFIGGNLAYYRLLHSATVSRLGPLTAMYVAVPVVLGVLVLRERLSAQQWVGVFLALLAGYLLANGAPANAAQ